MKTDGRNAALRIELGVAYLRTEEYDKALAELRIAVKLAPSSAEAHNWLGVALAAKADLVKQSPSMGRQFRWIRSLRERGRSRRGAGPGLANPRIGRGLWEGLGAYA